MWIPAVYHFLCTVYCLCTKAWNQLTGYICCNICTYTLGENSRKYCPHVYEITFWIKAGVLTNHRVFIYRLWNNIFLMLMHLRPPAKRAKAESLLPQVHATDSVPNAQKVIQNFLTAFKCYELLNSSPDLQRGKNI